MGRPKKQPAERRTISLSCRLTEAERLIIEQAAIGAGLSASDYVRRQLLTGKVIVRENRSLDHATFDQLRRIGVNLNQLTRIANRTGNIPYEIAKVAAAIEQLIVRELAPDSAPAESKMPGGQK